VLEETAEFLQESSLSYPSARATLPTIVFFNKINFFSNLFKKKERIVIMKDYYKILEVDKEYEKEDIKKSYRKMALKYHPDKNNGDDSKFKELSEAYEILSDGNKRRQYDYNCSHGVNYSTFGHQFMDPNDLFKEIFKNSDMDMMMSGFINPSIHQNNVSFDNIMNSFLSPDFFFNDNSSKSTSSSMIIQNGKKVVRTTTVENGVTRTEEKVYGLSINDA